MEFEGGVTGSWTQTSEDGLWGNWGWHQESAREGQQEGLVRKEPED